MTSMGDLYRKPAWDAAPEVNEGQGFSVSRILGYAPPAIAVQGELWSSKVRILLSPTPEEFS